MIAMPLRNILEFSGFGHALLSLHAIQGRDNARRLFACHCVRQALPLFEREFADDNRIRAAIETSERFARGLATMEEVEGACEKVTETRTNMPDSVKDAVTAACGARGVCFETAASSVLGVIWAAEGADAKNAANAILAIEFLRLCRLEGEYGEVDGNNGDKELSVTLQDLMEKNKLDNALYSLRAVQGHDNALRLFACHCAWRSLPIFEEAVSQEMVDDCHGGLLLRAIFQAPYFINHCCKKVQGVNL
jgi:hypothetical protein